MYFSMWLAFNDKAHDFLARMQRNSFEAYRSHCKNNMAERSKNFQNFASVLLSKIFERFAFKKLSNIFQRFPLKIFPAICFQNFASSLAFKKLSKIFQRFAFKKLSKFFQRLAFKIFPAITFQTFKRSEMAKI